MQENIFTTNTKQIIVHASVIFIVQCENRATKKPTKENYPYPCHAPSLDFLSSWLNKKGNGHLCMTTCIHIHVHVFVHNWALDWEFDVGNSAKDSTNKLIIIEENNQKHPGPFYSWICPQDFWLVLRNLPLILSGLAVLEWSWQSVCTLAAGNTSHWKRVGETHQVTVCVILSRAWLLHWIWHLALLLEPTVPLGIFYGRGGKALTTNSSYF